MNLQQVVHICQEIYNSHKFNGVRNRNAFSTGSRMRLKKQKIIKRKQYNAYAFI